MVFLLYDFAGRQPSPVGDSAMIANPVIKPVVGIEEGVACAGLAQLPSRACSPSGTEGLQSLP